MKNRLGTLNKGDLPDRSNRLYYLDWLRVIAIIAVFFHHCSKLFDLRNSHAITGFLPTVHREFGNLWMMPLFFMISGTAVYYSLKSRKVGGFIKERLLRILLPFVTIGIFVIAPPLVYVDQLINEEFSGSFFNWYPHYFKDWDASYCGHLWFLPLLFSYTLILLVFFIPMGKQKVSIFFRFSNLFKKSWGLLLLFIPLIGIAPLEIYSDRLAGGWDFLAYMLFFICGYLFFSNELIQESINRYCIINLAAAFVFTIIYLYIEFSAVIPEINSYMLTEYKTLSENTYNPPNLSMALIEFFVLRHLAACCWMIAIFGLASRYLNFSNRFIMYANEAVLPFYLLHLTIISIVGFFVLPLDISIGVKYFIITISALIAIMTIYELLIRRMNILRFLFGMKLTYNVRK